MSMIAAMWLAACVGASGCDDLQDPGSFRQAAGTGESPTGDGTYAVGWKPEVDVDRWVLPDFDLDVFYPALSDGAFDFRESPYPVVMLVQGGLVAREDYYFLADRISSWGYVVVLPSYPFDLASFGPTRASAALDRLEASMEDDTFWQGGLDLSRVAIGGHSLGGVVADWALGDPRFTALYLLASYPSGDDTSSFDGPVLSIAGGADCNSTVDEVYAGYQHYPGPGAYAEIAGMTHYQFTASDEEDEEECPTDLPLETAHADLSAVLIPFLKVYLEDDSSYLTALEARPSGVTIEQDAP